MSKQCSHCRKYGKLRRCSGCRQVYYCNRKCQLAHWDEHQHHCSDSADEGEEEAAAIEIGRSSSRDEEIVSNDSSVHQPINHFTIAPKSAYCKTTWICTPSLLMVWCARLMLVYHIKQCKEQQCVVANVDIVSVYVDVGLSVGLVGGRCASGSGHSCPNETRSCLRASPGMVLCK